MSATKKPQAVSMKYSAGFELNLPRSIRLKVVALQMPQVQKFLRKFSNKINSQQLYYKFQRWLSVYSAWRVQKEQLMLQRYTAAVPIQRIVRGFNGRHRFKRCLLQKQQQVVVEERRRWSMYQLQCFARLCILRHRASKALAIKRINKHGRAATAIQRTFRGFYSRGMTVELEKKKLIKQLRKWSHGISNHLVNMKELQNGYSQAVLYRAIQLSSLSSRPLRDLPRLQDVRVVRRALFLLYWRLQAHYSGAKEEYRHRQAERRGMYLQDLASQLVHTLTLGSIKQQQAVLLAQQRAMEREIIENAHRAALDSERMLLDLNSKSAAQARLQREHDIQSTYKAKLARLAELQKVIDDINKETELMRVEEIVTKTCVLELKKAHEQRQLIAQQALLVETAKLAGIVKYGEQAKYSKTVLATQVQQLVSNAVLPVAITRKPGKKSGMWRKPPPPAVSASQLGMDKYRAQKVDVFAHSVHAFKAYLYTQPLQHSYIDAVCEAMWGTQEMVEFPVLQQPAVSAKKSPGVSRGVQKWPVSAPKPSSVTPTTATVAAYSTQAIEPTSAEIAHAVLDSAFLTKQLAHSSLCSAFNPVTLLQHLNSQCMDVNVHIKGMLTRPQLLQLLGPDGYGMSIALQQYTMQLQSTLAVDDISVHKMRLLLQLRKHRQARLAGYNNLVRAHAQFKRVLSTLHAKRHEVHTTKYTTRQARKSALSNTAVIENDVLMARNTLIALCSTLYNAFHGEVELFLALFYPVEVLPEESGAHEEEQCEGIVSRKVLFNAAAAAAAANDATGTSSASAGAAVTSVPAHGHGHSMHAAHTLTHAAHASHGSAANATPAAKKRSSRIDAVYIAPKRKEQAVVAPKARSKRESILYTGGTAKKAHIVDPYHALHQVPVNKTLQHMQRKPVVNVDRTLMYADYWAGIQQDMQYFSLPPVQIVALPLAPIPTHDNDGKPHILKYGSSGIASKRVNASHVHKHYDTTATTTAPANNKGLLHKLKTTQTTLKQQKLLKKEVKLHDIPGFNLFQDSDCNEYDFYLWAEKTVLWGKEVCAWFRTQESAWRAHNRMTALTYLLRLQWLSDDNIHTHSDTHSHNMQHTREYYEAHMKASSMLVRKKMLAEKHRRESMHQYGRHRLSNTGSHAMTEEQQQDEKTLFLLRHLDQADILDMYEVLLCKSNIGLMVTGSEKKKVFLSAESPTSAAHGGFGDSTSGSVQNSSGGGSASSKNDGSSIASTGSSKGGVKGSGGIESTSSNYSRLITADELDVTVAKHPASLTARFLLIQQALAQEPEQRYNEQDLLHMSCQNALLFGTFSSTPGSDLTSTNVVVGDGADTAADVHLSQGIFHSLHPNIVLLHSLRQELHEIREILARLTSERSVRIELIPPAVAGKTKHQAPGAATTFIPITVEDFSVDLKYQEIRPIKYVQSVKDNDVWEYLYPSWMHPIVRFGVPAPVESFSRRLQLEQRSGAGGKYTRINATDNRADAAARVLLRFLRVAVVLGSFVRDKALAAHRLSSDQCMMLWEDSLGAAVRADEENRRIEALRQMLLKRTFLDKMLGCFTACALPRRKTRMIHSMQTQTFDSVKASPSNENVDDVNDDAARVPQVSACCGVQPKYAKVSTFTSEEEFQSVLKLALSQPLPVQCYPRRALTLLVRAVLTEMLSVEVADSFKSDSNRPTVDQAAQGAAAMSMSTLTPLDALLAKYPFLTSTDDMRCALRRAATERSSISATTHFRCASWVTGQAVHLNAHGQHVDASTQQVSTEQVSKMSAFYAQLGHVLDKTCTKYVHPVDAQPIPGRVIAPAIATSVIPARRKSLYGNTGSTKKAAAVVLPKLVNKEVVKPDGIRLQPEDLPIVSEAVAPVQEVWLGGGLRNLLFAMRVVEDVHSNPRGVAVLNSVLLPPPPPQVHPMSDAAALSDAESMLMMRKKLTAAGQSSKNPQFEETPASAKHASRKNGGINVRKKGVKSADEASVKIAKFIRKRTIISRSGKVQTFDSTKADVTPGTVSSGSALTSTTATAASNIIGAHGTTGSLSGSLESTKSKTTTTAVTTASNAAGNKAASKQPKSSEDAKATISKFLRSKRFNVTVSKSSKKYNYNGTRLRTLADYRIRTTKEAAAGMKIKNFLRNRSGKQVVDAGKIAADKAAAAAAAHAAAVEADAQLLRVAAAAHEQAENQRAIVCTTIYDLFSSARTGFSDRVLCQDRLWQFATHFTIKARNLCAASLRMLKHETPVRPLPTLGHLHHALILAVFRERYKFAVQPVKRLSMQDGKATSSATLTASAAVAVAASVKAVGATSNSRSSFTNAAAVLAPAAVPSVRSIRRYVQVIQGFCRIIKAKRVVRVKRLQHSL